MAKEKLFQVGVKGLIENKAGQVLLFKADVSKHRAQTTAYWDIPGGRIQDGHGVLDTLKREIKEEAGIATISNLRFFTSVISKHEIPTDSGKKMGLVLMIYKVTIPERSRIVLSEEHTGVEWVNKKEAAKRLAHKYPPEFTNLL
ncbi:NUDIX hydrolase [Candidatus Saccharibacteria bacterium]|nr:NUDIX hydrolase [Candidatus Saccharibacteria bacterium]